MLDILKGCKKCIFGPVKGEKFSLRLQAFIWAYTGILLILPFCLWITHDGQICIVQWYVIGIQDIGTRSRYWLSI